MKKFISILLVLTLISSLFPLVISASGDIGTNVINRKVYKVLECEENDIAILGVEDASKKTKDDTTGFASGGKYVESEYKETTWKFTPDNTGFYEFELVACITGDVGNSTFYVNTASYFLNEKLNTSSTMALKDKAKTKLGRYYLDKGKEYTLMMRLGADGVVVRYDCFNVYYEKYYEAENGITTQGLTSAYNVTGQTVTPEKYEYANAGALYTISDGGNLRIPVTVDKAGLYTVSVRGRSNTDVNMSVRIDEKVGKANDSGAVYETPGAVIIPSSEGKLAYNGDVAAFYMPEGDKLVSFIVKGGAYTCDYITICEVADPAFVDYEYLEAENYEKSDDINCTKAFSGTYDSANDKSHSGVRGAKLDLEYKLCILTDGTYKIKLIGAATGDDSVATIAVDADYEPMSAVVSNGTWTSQLTEIGELELKAGYHTFKVTADSEIILDAFIFEKAQTLSREIIVNAETDFDRQAGHNVGWYDTTPNGYDDNNQVRDTFGYVDVYAGNDYYANNVGQAVANMIGGEWFRYNVEVPYSGYYRLLMGVKTVSLQTNGTESNFTVTVNGNDITKTIPQRTDNYTSNPLPWDDFGLVYLDAGTNTIKIKFDNPSGNAQFDAFKLVYPDMSLYSIIDGGTTIIEAEDNYEAIATDRGDRILTQPGQYLAIKYNAPNTGAYKLTAIANGDKATDTAKPKVQIFVDGVSAGVFEFATSGPWNPVESPLETVIPELNLTAGQEHKIKFENVGGCTIGFDKFIFNEPDAVQDATSLTAGQYRVVADLNDWYAGYTKTDGGAKINWTSDEYIDTLAVIAAVYDGTEFKSGVVTSEVNNKNEAVLDGINVEDGNTIKVFIWDYANVKPLTDYVIYE